MTNESLAQSHATLRTPIVPWQEVENVSQESADLVREFLQSRDTPDAVYTMVQREKVLNSYVSCARDCGEVPELFNRLIPSVLAEVRRAIADYRARR